MLGKKKTRLLAIIVIIILLAIALKYFAFKEEKMKVPSGYTERMTLTAEVTINFVFVGFEENVINPDLILEGLPTYYQPSDWGRTNVFGWYFEYLFYTFKYNFVFATEDFAEALFSYANELAEWGAPPDYLTNYDEESGQNRLEEGEEIQYVSVTAVEKWINDNKAKYGLEFAPPDYILFLFDSYTKGYMPTDTYHYWKHYEERYRTEYTDNLQAWGGNYSFLWFDLGAAPSEYQGEDSAEEYPPIWHYDETTYDILNRNISERIARFAIHYRFIPSYIYHPINRPIYISSHIWIDDITLLPPDFVEQVDFNECLERVRSFMPWFEWQGSHIVYMLPEDDPGMDETLKKARFIRGGVVTIDAHPVMNYITRNSERYNRAPEGFYNIWVNHFVLSDVQSFEFPAYPYGMAVPGPDGKPWGTLGLINDIFRLNMPTERAVAWFETLLVHEPGHIVGVRHPHDGVVIENDTYREGPRFWLWDQSATIMSYRVVTWGGDGLDSDLLARGNIMLNVHETYKNLDIVYENLRGKGREWITGELFRKVSSAKSNIERACKLFERCEWRKGVELSWKALQSSEEALNLSGGLSYKTTEIAWTETVTHVGGDEDLPFWQRININPYHDYKDFEITHGDEYAVVEVRWDNGVLSRADFYVGWNFNATEPGAIFDLEEEQNTEIEGCLERIIIDFDDDGIREAGLIYAGMGMCGGYAVNLRYDVRIVIYTRFYWGS